MKKKSGIIGLVAILAVLLISGAVFAEGEEPPAPEECANCEVSALYVDTALIEEQEADGSLVESMEGQATETTENELLEAEIVLVDNYGMPMDMASQANADILSAPDPYFTVGLITYRFFSDPGVCASLYPGDPNCLDDQGDDVIQDAIDYISSSGIIPTDKKIYIDSGAYGAADVTIDGSQPNLATISGLIGRNTTGTNPIINGNIYINALQTGFTLKGFTINGSVSIVNSTGDLLLEDLNMTGGTGDGIKIGNNTYHSGAVTLKEVKSSGNSGKGADIFAMGNITITNSAFDDNGDDGLFLRTMAGTITIKGVSASNNTNTGIRSIDFKKTVTLQQVLVNNNGNGGLSFSDSDAYGAFKIDTLYARNNAVQDGVYINTKGAITLNKVMIENSGYIGLNISHSTSSASIILSEISSCHNTDRGIFIDTLGNVTARSIIADKNGGTGMEVNNRYQGALGVITINSLASSGPTMANSFSYNIGGSGLLLRSNKNITLSNLDAMGNGGDGLYAQTDGSLIINKTLPNWSNAFNDNGGNGIYAKVAGGVTLGYVGASNNSNGYGVFFDQPALNVTITGGTFDNNAKHGLYIVSSGNVLLNDVGSAANNDSAKMGYYNGIYIDASYGTGSVTVKNTSKTGISTISGNSGEGLLIGAKGNVLVNGVIAENNGGTGISINNKIGDAIKPVFITRAQGNNNLAAGLRIFTAGSVTLQDLQMVGNGNEGALIDACDDMGLDCRTTANVILKGSNRFLNNALIGLQIETKGAVTINILDAGSNSQGGVYVKNAYPSAVGPVLIGGTSTSLFDGNGSFGVRVESHGLITLKNMTVKNTIDSGFYGGVYLRNDFVPARSVTLTDVQILNNVGTGLMVISQGPVSLLGVESSSNTWHGVHIDVPNSVRVTSGKTLFSNFDNNLANGAYILSESTVTVSNVGASGNQASGLIIYAPNGIVTIGNNHKTFFSNFNNNGVNGISVTAGGAITLNNRIIANGNGSTGIYLDNNSSTFKAISIKGVEANENHGYGLDVQASGNLTLADVTASFNENYGSYLGVKGNLIISGTNEFSSNKGAGLVFGCFGSVNISGVTADNNTGSGISGNSNTTGMPVLIKNSVLRWNSDDGLQLNSGGNLTLDGVQSLMNGGDGVDIDPTYSITTLIKNSAFMGNDGYGIKVLAGYYTISNTFYLANDLGGINLY